MPDPSTTSPVSEAVEKSAEAAPEPQDDASSLDAEVDALISRVQKAAAEVERRASGEDADFEAAGFPSPQPSSEPAPAPLPEPEPEQETEPEATTESAAEVAAETPDSAVFADVEEAIAEAEAVAAEELGNLTDDAPEATAPDSPAAADAPAVEEAQLGESVDAAIAAAETVGEVEALEAALAEPEPEPAEPASAASSEEVAEPVKADTVESASAFEPESGVEAVDFDSVDTILEESADTDDVADAQLDSPPEVEADTSFEPAEETLSPPGAEAAEEAVNVAVEAGEGADGLGNEDDHHFESFEEATSDSEAAAVATPPVDEVEVEVDESAEAPDEVESSEQTVVAASEAPEATEDAVTPVAVVDAVEPVADPAAEVTAAPTKGEPGSIAPAWRRVQQKTTAWTITAAAKIGPLARVIRERTPQYWAVVRPRLRAVLHLLNAPYRRLSPQMREFVGWAAVVTAFAACSVWIIIALRG